MGLSVLGRGSKAAGEDGRAQTVVFWKPSEESISTREEYESHTVRLKKLRTEN